MTRNRKTVRTVPVNQVLPVRARDTIPEGGATPEPERPAGSSGTPQHATGVQPKDKEHTPPARPERGQSQSSSASESGSDIFTIEDVIARLTAVSSALNDAVVAATDALVPTEETPSKDLIVKQAEGYKNWLKAYKEGIFPPVDAEMQKARQRKAKVMRKMHSAYESYITVLNDNQSRPDDLEPYHEQILALLPELKNARDGEQAVWEKQIERDGNSELFVSTFVLEHEIMGEPPSKLTDLEVKSMMERLREGSTARTDLCSLHSSNCEGDWPS